MRRTQLTILVNAVTGQVRFLIPVRHSEWPYPVAPVVGDAGVDRTVVALTRSVNHSG
jgi:hypothetical protein